MNSLVISFLVGGFLILSMLSYQRLMHTHSREMVLGRITQQNLGTLVDILDNDFNKAGFKATNSPVIQTMDSTEVVFLADVFDNDSLPVSPVRWQWNSDADVTETTNPNDFELQRTGPVSASVIDMIRFPVTHFRIRYFDAQRNPTNDANSVRSIEVEIMMESPEPYRYDKSGKGYYYRTGWKRTFVPNNLNLPG